MVYFYSERPLLSKIFYSMCGLFLYRKTAALQRSVARGFGGVSQIMLLFFLFFLQNIRKQYYGLPQGSLWLHNFYSNDNMKFEVLWFLNIAIFKSFCDVSFTNELIDLWWLNKNLRILYSVYEIKNVPRFIGNLRIGRISSNLKKKKYVWSILS